MMRDDELVAWLLSNSGPILRYRVAASLAQGVPPAQKAQWLHDSLATPEVQRWLDNLGGYRGIHGSKDTDAENPLSKLLDYGLDRTVPALDERVQALLSSPWAAWEDLVVYPFLVRAGYAEHPRVAECLARRVELLFRTAQRGSFDFYLGPEEAPGVPKAWRGKPIYRDEVGHAAGYALPTCYDLYAMAYCPPVPYIEDLVAKAEAIAGFLSDPRFQSAPDGYGWDRPKRRCYAAGRVFLACVQPARLVLFLELGARFAAARRAEWFRVGLALIEGYRTPRGTYRTPRGLLAEKAGTHLYGGSHMGLGEDRRSPQALELESTFRMLSIRRRMGIDGCVAAHCK